MDALRRHRLVRLAPAAWRSALDDAADDEARDCLGWWADHDLPLVVARQRIDRQDDALHLGLPTPLRWGRRRLAVVARMDDIVSTGSFPAPHDVVSLLPPPVRSEWLVLGGQLAAIGAAGEVYGSFGWERLSGLACTGAGSDLDLLVTVADEGAADAAARLLGCVRFPAPRLDGELMFANGSAVAWREWRRWRAGSVGQLLVKRLEAAVLERDGSWLEAAHARAATP